MPQSQQDAFAAVLATARGMLESGLTSGTSGNVSSRLDDGHIVITPSSVPYPELTAEDLVVLDLDGTQVTGHRSPSSEKLLHLACYQAFGEVTAVLHSHPPHATMFACARQPVPPVIDEAFVFVGGEVPVAGYAMSGSAEVGLNAAAVLRDVGSALLASHGLVTVAASPADALRQAGIVEHCARVAWGALALGGHVPVPAKAAADLSGVYQYLRHSP
ncbi:MAG: class II aldolase/adducin family protein [Streptosporangiaceae bacterium]